MSSIIGNRKGTSGSGHGTGHGLGGAAAGVAHKSGGGGKLLKKVGAVAVVGLAGKARLFYLNNVTAILTGKAKRYIRDLWVHFTLGSTRS